MWRTLAIFALALAYAPRPAPPARPATLGYGRASIRHRRAPAAMATQLVGIESTEQ